jgi:hypothetical protein
MNTLERYQAAKDRAEDLRRRVDKATGSLERLMEELRERFDVDSVEAAEKLAEKLQADLRKKEKAFERAVAKFEEQWSEQFGEDE